MNLPDFTQFEPLNRLKDEIGIPATITALFLRPAISPAPGSF